MKRLKKKILGILLSIVMVLGLMPVGMPVRAAEQSDTYNTASDPAWTGVETNYYKVLPYYVEQEGIRLDDYADLTIEAKNGARITKVELVKEQNSNGAPVCYAGDYNIYARDGDIYTFGDITTDEIKFRSPNYSCHITQLTVWYEPPVTNHTVTYKVANGTWGDGTTADKTETVADGSSPAHVPTGMTASDGYTGGSWNTNPANATITADTTFTYTFTDSAAATSFDIPVKVEGTPDGSTGHIELDQQVAIDLNSSDTAIDVMTGVGGFTIYLRPLTQGPAAPISGTYEFTYNGTTYTGSFTATIGYIGPRNCWLYASMPVPLSGGSDSSDSSSSSGHHHHKCENGHIFSFQVLEAATTEKDGVGMWCCERCGIPDWNEHENAAPGEKVVISAYTVFNDTLENNIKAAESGATVSITTSRWVSVRRGVLEALAEKPGVTLTVNFEYQGMGYVIAIPGGDPALAGILALEDRFFGLMNLGNTYGLTAVEK